MVTATVPRLYHSTALLLPDGRVVAAGGNPEGGRSATFEPPDPDEEMRLEVFSPPYLFKDARPIIDGAPTQATYGDTITIASHQAGSIRWASLIRNGVTTHSFDTSQRLVDLDIVAQGSGTITATITDNPNLAPPGWFMLFLTDLSGIPSTAHWLQLASIAPFINKENIMPLIDELEAVCGFVGKRPPSYAVSAAPVTPAALVQFQSSSSPTGVIL